MKRGIVLEPSDEGGYTVYVPWLPGCISEGDTEREAPATWQRYRAALALGGREPLGTLFDTAGARWPFDPEVVRDDGSFAAHQSGVDRRWEQHGDG